MPDAVTSTDFSVHAEIHPKDLQAAAHLRMVDENTILAAVIGSRLSGLATADSDTDELAVAVEPPNSVFAVASSRFETHVSRPRPEGERARPGDVERTTYSLRKYLSLAASGNPHILSLLWAPEQLYLHATDEGRALLELRSDFVTSRAISAFYGYATAQRKRLTSASSKRGVRRPELEAVHGYDTKYAAHVLRLAYQGGVLAYHGYLPQPIPEPVRSEIMAVRLGRTGLTETLELIDTSLLALHRALGYADAHLPSSVDSKKLSEFSREAHLSWWSQRGLA